MDRLSALQLIRVAVAGISRLAQRDTATLDDLVQQHRAMARIPAARQQLRAAIPAVRRLRDACERVLNEFDQWPVGPSADR
jgi:hypothetical protein